MSVIATITVRRRELTREARIRLYDEILPRLFGSEPSRRAVAFETHDAVLDECRMQMRRTAAIAGRSTFRQADAVLDAMFEYDEAMMRDDLLRAEAAAEHDLAYEERADAAAVSGQRPPDKAPDLWRPSGEVDEKGFAVTRRVAEFSNWLERRIR